MINKIVLKNVGKFENTSHKEALDKLTLIYAENGRGKTTLANIFRSLKSNDSTLIEDRRRLRLEPTKAPYIVIKKDGQSFIYEDGRWQSHLSDIAVFDDNFVAQNVHSGMEVGSGHRQNLHELIIGVQGVKLNAQLQAEVKKIEEHNRVIKEKKIAITYLMGGTLSVDEFCDLQELPNIEGAIQQVQKDIKAAESADLIRGRSDFQPIELPTFDVEAIKKLLLRDLPNLQQDAADKVRKHLEQLGDDAESWINKGMDKIPGDETCPFCAQDLEGSQLIAHYKNYFSKEYTDLKESIIAQSEQISAEHNADIQTSFEREVQVATQNIEFWKEFVKEIKEMESIPINTIEIASAWKAVRKPILETLKRKAATPLDSINLSDEIIAAIDTYEKHRKDVTDFSEKLQGYNAQITSLKEPTAETDLMNLNAKLAELELRRTRHTPTTSALCQEYLNEKAEKKATEKKRDAAREELNTYRIDTFKKYQESINKYLKEFLADFRLESMKHKDVRTGTSCDYGILINEVRVPTKTTSGPSFKNTLSSGDRNTLALAFFLASLDKDPNRSSKIVVIDDPETSLDEHRSSHTIQRMIELTNQVEQLILLSHSKPFLCEMWKRFKQKISPSTLHITRLDTSSELEKWDMRQACATEHDRHHTLITEYIKKQDSSKQQAVASALRPTLEFFLRVAYPCHFPHGTQLGTFIDKCTQDLERGNAIMKQGDINELKVLANYSHNFHHPDRETINDRELVDYCKRVIAFTKRP